jgi:hypothetical protein
MARGALLLHDCGGDAASAPPPVLVEADYRRI